MKKLIIHGGKSLSGEVTISCAKNSVVALIPATLLAGGIVHLERVPDISDVDNLIAIMTDIGARITRHEDMLTIDTTHVLDKPVPSGKVDSLRVSYYFYGALLGRFGQAQVGLPGGCDLGPRPIDLHIKSFEAMGAEISTQDNYMSFRAPKEGLKGAHVFLDIASVGATINVLLVAVTAQGQTVIENAAKEPEIIDVAILLNNMGARVKGAGTDTVTIDGVRSLHGARHQVIPDRIEAGTYMALAAAVDSAHVTGDRDGECARYYLS